MSKFLKGDDLYIANRDSKTFGVQGGTISKEFGRVPQLDPEIEDPVVITTPLDGTGVDDNEISISDRINTVTVLSNGDVELIFDSAKNFDAYGVGDPFVEVDIFGSEVIGGSAGEIKQIQITRSFYPKTSSIKSIKKDEQFYILEFETNENFQYFKPGEVVQENTVATRLLSGVKDSNKEKYQNFYNRVNTTSEIQVVRGEYIFDATVEGCDFAPIGFSIEPGETLSIEAKSLAKSDLEVVVGENTSVTYITNKEFDKIDLYTNNTQDRQFVKSIRNLITSDYSYIFARNLYINNEPLIEDYTNESIIVDVDPRNNTISVENGNWLGVYPDGKKCIESETEFDTRVPNSLILENVNANKWRVGEYGKGLDIFNGPIITDVEWTTANGDPLTPEFDGFSCQLIERIWYLEESDDDITYTDHPDSPFVDTSVFNTQTGATPFQPPTGTLEAMKYYRLTCQYKADTAPIVKTSKAIKFRGKAGVPIAEMYSARFMTDRAGTVPCKLSAQTSATTTGTFSCWAKSSVAGTKTVADGVTYNFAEANKWYHVHFQGARPNNIGNSFNGFLSDIYYVSGENLPEDAFTEEFYGIRGPLDRKVILGNNNFTADSYFLSLEDETNIGKDYSGLGNDFNEEGFSWSNPGGVIWSDKWFGTQVHLANESDLGSLGEVPAVNTKAHDGNIKAGGNITYTTPLQLPEYNDFNSYSCSSYVAPRSVTNFQQLNCSKVESAGCELKDKCKGNCSHASEIFRPPGGVDGSVIKIGYSSSKNKTHGKIYIKDRGGSEKLLTEWFCGRKDNCCSNGSDCDPPASKKPCCPVVCSNGTTKVKTVTHNTSGGGGFEYIKLNILADAQGDGCQVSRCNPNGGVPFIAYIEVDGVLLTDSWITSDNSLDTPMRDFAKLKSGSQANTYATADGTELSFEPDPGLYYIESNLQKDQVIGGVPFSSKNGTGYNFGDGQPYAAGGPDMTEGLLERDWSAANGLSTYYFYNEREDKMISLFDMKRKYGISGANKVMGIFELSEQPNYKVAYFHRHGDKFVPVPDYSAYADKAKRLAERFVRIKTGEEVVIDESVNINDYSAESLSY